MPDTSQNRIPRKPIRHEDEFSTRQGLAELAQLARQAFEDNRRKQSLAITNAILKIDSEQKEALVLQSWIRADLHRDFDAASTLIADARAQNDTAMYERTERLLRSILIVDPDHEETKSLLAAVISEQTALPEKMAAPETVIPPQGYPMLPSTAREGPIWHRFALPLVLAIAIFGLIKLVARNEVAAVQTEESKDVNVTSPPEAEVMNATYASVDLYVLPSVGVSLSVDDAPVQPVERTIRLAPGTHSLAFSANGYSTKTVSQTIESGEQQVLPVILERIDNNAPAAVAAGATKREPPRARPSSRSDERPLEPRTSSNPPAPRMGRLAISSVAPVDVYFGGERLGKTPLTVQLPSGPQTLEFRYQNLTKSASYIIEPDETTRASVAFEVVLQINARPWAQILIEGVPRVMLGETPLGNVRVSVGSVLVFRHPEFLDKRYVVTGKEQAIEVVFP